MKKSLLIIGSNADLAKSMQDYLEESGYAISHELSFVPEMLNGHDACLIQQAVHKDTSRLKTVGSIRAMNSQIPILLLVFGGESDDAFKAFIRAGCSYIADPNDQQQMLVTLRTIFSKLQ